jgi:L-ascorbate metabolism protein UlaG (beta-lactamase superfamily)
MSITIHWFGHASFRISGSKTVFIDPWKLPPGSGPADVVIVSHSHYDHLSPEDVASLRGKDTAVLAPPDCLSKLKGKVTSIAPGQLHELVGVRVETVPAYNVHKQFHPKASGWVGVVVTLDGKRVYYAGDTDHVPEMGQLKSIDVALLPVGGTYTMNAAEAAAAVKAIKPARAVPYHWGDIVGARKDADDFAAKAGCPVTVLTPGGDLALD